MNAGNYLLKRNHAIEEINAQEIWDVLVIGGGATGLGTALDAASRGFKTLLAEQYDFAKGTSSRSTKLIHGGVRYLAQGNFALVKEALRERGRLLDNAPQLVSKQSFIIPCYSWFEVVKYLSGLTFYDWMSGKHSFGKSVYLNKQQVMAEMPDLNEKGLKGGVRYYDGRFDDAKLAVSIARTAAGHGAVLVNYMQVAGLNKTGGRIDGAILLDMETRQRYEVKARVVINATGVYVDEVLKLDRPDNLPMVRPSQGVHIVVDRSFLKGENALLIPKTSDGRVLFAVPWHRHLLVGTTDTPVGKALAEPVALEKEIDFILETAGQYFTKKPVRKDILSVFAGLRPLAVTDKSSGSTKEISRGHKLVVSGSGLVTITGGKWTTYRKMAEDTVDKAIITAGLERVSCRTHTIKLYDNSRPWTDDLLSDPAGLQQEVILAVREEMARTVEDVLARRLRTLFTDVQQAKTLAPSVAGWMAAELGRDAAWEAAQVKDFLELAAGYSWNRLSALTGKNNRR